MDDEDGGIYKIKITKEKICPEVFNLEVVAKDKVNAELIATNYVRYGTDSEKVIDVKKEHIPNLHNKGYVTSKTDHIIQMKYFKNNVKAGPDD